MPQVSQPCKICGKPATARWDDGAPQEAVDKFLPMLVHNHCGDLMRKFNDSEDRIVSLCIAYARAGTDDKGKMVSMTRVLLLKHTRNFAEAVAELRHLPNVIWTEEFVDLLLEKPDKVGRILRDYKDSLPDGEQMRIAAK